MNWWREERLSIMHARGLKSRVRFDNAVVTQEATHRGHLVLLVLIRLNRFSRCSACVSRHRRLPARNAYSRFCCNG